MENLPLNSFKRVNEKVSPELIGQDELSVLVNGILSGDGNALKPRKRGGFGRFNSNNIDSSGEPYSIHDVVDSVSSNYVLATIATKLRKSLAGTGSWSDVKTGLTTNLKTRIASYGGDIFVTNGTDAMFVLQGAGFASNTTVEIVRPDVSLITSDHSSGGILTADKRYHYILVYVTEGGQMSPPSKPFTHWRQSVPYYYSTDSTNKTLTFSNVPVSSDSRVVSRYIFRTEGFTAGSTDTYKVFLFYFLKALDNTVTSFVDDDADDALNQSRSISYLNTPTRAKYLAIHKDRLVLANITTTKKNFFEPVHTKSGNGREFGGNSSDTGTTGVFQGTDYKWGITLLHENGLESEMEQMPNVYHTTGVYPDSTTVTLTQLPLVGQASYVNPIIGRKLYRTKRGDTAVFYYLATLDTDDGSYTDNTPDSSLGAVYVVPTTQNFTNGIAFSEIEQPSVFKEESILQIYPDDGDVVTAVFDDNDGFIIFKQNSICKIFTNTGSPIYWVRVKLVDNIGCSEPDAICKNGDEYFFIHNKRAYLYKSGSSIPEPISDLYVNSFDAMTSFYSVSYISTYNWYVLSGLVSSVHKIYIYDVTLKSWSTFSVTRARDLKVKKYGTNAGTFLIAGGTASVASLIKYDPTQIIDYENGADQTQYSMQVRTKTFTFSDGITLGRSRILHFNYNKISGQDIVLVMYNPDNAQSKTKTYNSSSGWISSKDSTDALTGSLLEFNKLYYDITGNGFKEFGALRHEHRLIRKGKNIAA